MVYLQTFIGFSWQVLCELAPWLLLGMLLSGLIHVLLPVDFIRRQFRGSKGVLSAVGLGIPLPLCSCGVIPTAIGLQRQGASNGASIGFLISTPQTGVDSLLVSAAFFGWPFAFYKMLVALITGLLGGWLVDWSEKSTSQDACHASEDSASNPAGDKSSLPTCCQSDHSVESPSEPSEPSLPVIQSGSLPVINHAAVVHNIHMSTEVNRHGMKFVAACKRLVIHGMDILRSIWFWLVVGILLSATLQTFVPVEGLQAINDQGLMFAMFLALLISLPLYVCATASVPIAAAMVQAGFPPAAALVFLVAGPATNITTMGTIQNHFGWRSLSIYLSVLILGSIGFGWLFESLISQTGGFYATGKENEHLTHHQHEVGTLLEILSGILVGSLLVYFALLTFRQRLTWFTQGKRQ